MSTRSAFSNDLVRAQYESGPQIQPIQMPRPIDISPIVAAMARQAAAPQPIFISPPPAAIPPSDNSAATAVLGLAGLGALAGGVGEALARAHDNPSPNLPKETNKPKVPAPKQAPGAPKSPAIPQPPPAPPLAAPVNPAAPQPQNPPVPPQPPQGVPAKPAPLVAKRPVKPAPRVIDLDKDNPKPLEIGGDDFEP